MDLNYYDTLIAVAEDCPVDAGVDPPLGRDGKKTIAVVQFEMLSDRPGALTQEDVLFETWLRRQEGLGALPEAERAELRARLFAKPQACLRASPLPKKYGWGLLFDAQGRITLCPMESEDYRRIAAGSVPDVTVRRAMRSRRG
ncbi:DUF6157 family protein [Planomonospora parontospora]|uniref:DUF6157 family protein n=1 Tax=Planomonospora parontospora TaxID=58119 RepID=UPI001670ACF0|nr:DUF6157 family protein [Planomonospora parontospora]GGL12814.1 hypothetical protein GCM10014719_13450 [Planomonospora parontospora subsp. antibiotica]GII13993.1 hypothetical protein Ppa05_07190 [Planomonospora parontospora subsp. antibiotica]